MRVPWRPLAVAVVGLAVAGTAYFLLDQQVRRATAAPKVEPVLMAARTIPAYQVIQEGDLRWGQVPAGSRPEGAVVDPQEVLGRAARDTIFAGEPIRKERLLDSPLVLGPTERAIAIPTDLIRSVGGSVVPGDRVDVLWVTSADVEAQVLASGAVVMDLRAGDGRSLVRWDTVSAVGGSVVQAVREATQQVTAGAPAQGAQAVQTRQSVPAAVILRVSESEALRIARSLAGGQIVLVKRQ